MRASEPAPHDRFVILRPVGSDQSGAAGMLIDLFRPGRDAGPGADRLAIARTPSNTPTTRRPCRAALPCRKRLPLAAFLGKPATLNDTRSKPPFFADLKLSLGYAGNDSGSLAFSPPAWDGPGATGVPGPGWIAFHKANPDRLAPQLPSCAASMAGLSRNAFWTRWSAQPSPMGPSQRWHAAPSNRPPAGLTGRTMPSTGLSCAMLEETRNPACRP